MTNGEQKAPLTSSERFVDKDGKPVRVGDVLQYIDGKKPRECRILSLTRTYSGVSCEWFDMIGAGSIPPEMCTLLRRPVRVGDIIRNPDISPNGWKVTGINATSWDHGLAATPTPFSRAGCYQHQDGTPIDPPASTDSKSNDSIGQRSTLPSGASVSYDKALMNKPTKAPDPPPSAEYWRERFNLVDREREDLKRQMSMLEADVKTVNNDFAKALAEHKAEIDFLRRELKRNDPRLWEARYGVKPKVTRHVL